MKKLLIFICLILLFSVSCTEVKRQKQTYDSNSDTLNVLPPDNYITDEKVYEEGVNYSYYKLFEELLNNAFSIDEVITDVIKATYIDTEKAGGCYYHRFEVFENIRGLGVNTLMTVRSKSEKRAFYDSDLEVFDTSEIGYEKGETYLLLLKRSYTVADGVERFRAVDDSLILPLNDEGKIDAENAKIYGDRLLSHVFDISLRKALLEGTFEEYILEAIKENVFIFSYETETIDSDLEATLLYAPYVLEIMLTDVDRINDRIPNDFNDIRLCSGKITKVYKAVEDVVTVDDEVTINLHIDRIEKNKKYIFAVFEISYYYDDYSSRHYFQLVNGNAMFDVSEEENIKEILKSYKLTE